jgi:hypothetical protein
MGLVMTPAEKSILVQLADAAYCSEADIIRKLLLKEAKRLGMVSKHYDPIENED